MPTKKKPKPSLGAAWMSVTDVRDALARSRENKEALTRRVSELKARIDRRREDAAADLADFSPQERDRVLNRIVSGVRADLRAKSADERKAMVREAGRLQELLASARVHYGSPVQMLMRSSLGSERRSRLMEQLAASGPAELASLAALAASTKDHELAAALCSRLSQIERGQRPFSAQDLAEAMVGHEYREVNRAILEAERLTLEALTEDAAFETGKPQGRAVKLALMRKEEARFDVADDDEDEAEDDASEDAEDTPETEQEEG